jgi:hypothetical protein
LAQLAGRPSRMEGIKFRGRAVAMSQLGHSRRPLQHSAVRQLPLCPVRDRGLLAVQNDAKGQLRKFPFHRREVKNASRGLNKNIPAILNRIEFAHTLNEGRSWHPHPASAPRVDVKDKERVGFSVVCAKRRDMSGALLAYSLTLVGDDYIITPMLEVFDQISPNILLGLAAINDNKPGRKTIRP